MAKPARLWGGVSIAALAPEAERTGYDYLITNDADWTTVFANSDATLSGKIIQILSTATLSAKTLSGRVFTSEVIIRGGKRSVKPVITSTAAAALIPFGGCQNITFQDIDFWQQNDDWGVIGATSTNTNIKFQHCKIHGVPFDLFGDYDATTGSPVPMGSNHNGIAIGGGAYFNNLEITDCEIYDLKDGVLLGVKTGPCIVRGNEFHSNYGDNCQINGDAANPPSYVEKSWNVSWKLAALSTDHNNPHSDHFQIQAAAAAVELRHFGNIYFNPPTESRGQPQAIFVQTPASGAHSGESAYNISLSIGGGGQAFYIGTSQYMHIHHNFVGRHSPGTGTGVVSLEAATTTNEDVHVRDNIAEGYILGAAVIQDVDNTVLANTVPAYTAYGAESIATIAQAQALGESLWPNISYTNRTIDRTNEHPGVGFITKVDEAASSTSTSSASRIKSGPTNQAYTTDTGQELQYADDAAFTVNASAWLSGSGTINSAVGKYVRVRHTNSASNAAATTTTLTLNGKSITYQSLTVGTPYNRTSFNPGAPNPPADYFTKATPATGLSDTDKFTIAVYWEPRSRPVGSNGSILRIANTAWVLEHKTTGVIGFTGRNNSGTVVCSFDISGLGSTWDDGSYSGLHKLLITIDLSQSTISAGVKVWFDGSEKTISSGTWTSGNVLNMDSASTLQIFFGSATRGYDAEFGMVYLNAGVVADLSSIVVRAAFESDNIGATGAGPTGAQPQICIYGNAAGISNKGSVTGVTLTGTIEDI